LLQVQCQLATFKEERHLGEVSALNLMCIFPNSIEVNSCLVLSERRLNEDGQDIVEYPAKQYFPDKGIKRSPSSLFHV
jgi:hypothetical protein